MALVGSEMICDCCGKPSPECNCPSCHICGRKGDPKCYHQHGLVYSKEQEMGQEAYNRYLQSQQEADIKMDNMANTLGENKYPASPEVVSHLMEGEIGQEPTSAPPPVTSAPATTAPQTTAKLPDEEIEVESLDELEETVEDMVTVSIDDYVRAEPDDQGSFAVLEDYTIGVDVTQFNLADDTDVFEFPSASGIQNVTAHHPSLEPVQSEISWQAKPESLATIGGKKFLIYRVSGR